MAENAITDRKTHLVEFEGPPSQLAYFIHRLRMAGADVDAYEALYETRSAVEALQQVELAVTTLASVAAALIPLMRREVPEVTINVVVASEDESHRHNQTRLWWNSLSDDRRESARRVAQDGGSLPDTLITSLTKFKLPPFASYALADQRGPEGGFPMPDSVRVFILGLD